MERGRGELGRRIERVSRRRIDILVPGERLRFWQHQPLVDEWLTGASLAP